MEGIFVTGTDTNVGKTTICAGFLKLIYGTRPVQYWKPIQTGTVVGDDTNDIKSILGIGPEFFMEPAYRFPEPVAPYLAARKWGKTIDLSQMEAQYRNAKKAGAFTVVEGAGGLLVPLSDSILQLDLIKRLGLPIVLVAEDRVGAINHSLLTLRVCAQENVKVIGVVLSKTRGNVGNQEAIELFGKVPVLGSFSSSEDVKTTIAQVSCHPKLREVFNVNPLPA